ncbi:uncharacterized protein LOC116200900 [Punica granatum]|uniref:Uncharacterized protein LOC116200900 n=1 Tax=Punica granatum TaxID=22663 RepID=A0A218W0P3_PUNGR|nr:uncharacterized protein LOC116200900 [Punica granatum]OWM66315.1 hypothetical protein CDL15_Pgr013532 [Punica granatum]
MSDSDSDAPEEFSAEQGLHQDEELRRIQSDNKARVKREGKERRRLWAQRKTPRASKVTEDVQEVGESGTDKDENEYLINKGMLPSDIVDMLAAREKQVFLSDSEDEKPEAKPTKRKKHKKSGSEPVILNEIPPPQCLQNSLDFLKKRKMQVARSNLILNNPNQALRFLSNSGMLTQK